MTGTSPIAIHTVWPACGGRKARPWLAIAYLACVLPIAVAAAPVFHTSIQAEFASGTVNTILQDRQGFLWVGTRFGLFRYDGSRVRAFVNDPQDPNSLTDNNVISLFEASDGRIWIGTFGGDLSFFDPRKGNFQHRMVDPNHPDRLTRRSAFAISEDTAGNPWIGTHDGLFVLGKPHRQGNRIWPTPQLAGRVSAHISSLVRDIHGRIWAGTENGVLVFNPDTTLRSHFLATDQSNTVSTWVTRIALGANGSMWLGTAEKGLLWFDPGTGKIVPMLKDTTRGRITALLSDRRGRVWVGYRNQGISIFDPATQNLMSFQRFGGASKLPDDDIQALFQDRSGVVWIGTFNAGLVFSNPLESQFGKIPTPPCLNGAAIYAVSRDEKWLWFGSYGEGLARIDRKDGSCRRFSTAANPESIPGNYVFALLPDGKRRLWVGTFAHGLARLDKDKDTWTRVPGPTGLPRALRISALAPAHRGGLWVGTLGTGLFHYNERAEQPWTAVGERGMEVYSISADSQRTLWVGTQNGIYAMNPFSGALHAALQKDASGRQLRVYGITNASGMVWAASNRGLYRFDPVTAQRTQFRRNEQFYSIQVDADQDIWVAGSHGLSRFRPGPQRFDDYRAEDGLQGNEFTSASFRDSVNGDLFFAGVNGVNNFAPQSIIRDPTPPQVALSAFYLFNRPADRNTATGMRLLPMPINYLQHLTLTSKDYVVAFEMAALHFADPARNRFAYKLEGFDPAWNYTDSDYPRATYTNLPAGEYTLHVKASNEHGVWNQTGTQLAISVLPPWWMTWWARSTYLILIAGLSFALFRYRTMTIRRRNAQLTDLVATRTSQLATEKRVVEQLLARKNEEFADVSHEFRTPLTLIIGPVRALLKTRLRQTAKAKLEVVARNAYRLLRLVDQLLDLERLRTRQIAMHRRTRLDSELALLAASFGDLAADKGVVMELGNVEETWVEVSTDALEKIIGNLLSNSVKYTPPGGEIFVSLQRCGCGRVSLAVKDSGRGIPKSDQDAVFERFYRVQDAHSEHITGAGIGLALVKELVESHAGSISLDSDAGEGTTVTIEFAEVVAPDRAPAAPSSIEPVNMEAEAAQLHVADQTPAFTHFVPTPETGDTLLVVDDNPDLRSFIVAVLSELYQCIAAANGREGVAVALREIPDLIVSDIMMPEMDGFELSRTLKEDERTCHIPIIMLTARGDRQSRLRSWREYADEFLIKPFDEEELLLRVSNLLAIRKILQTRFGASLTKHHGLADIAKLGLGPRDQTFLGRLTAIFEQQHGNCEFSMEEMAACMNMSVRQLQRKIKGLTGHSPKELLRIYRLHEAQRHLCAGDRPNEVAYTVGFSSPAYFARCFKAQFGITASEYSQHTGFNATAPAAPLPSVQTTHLKS